MSKNKFGIPGILFNPTPSPVPGAGVIGGGTAQGGLHSGDSTPAPLVPMSFTAWASSGFAAAYDFNADGNTEQNEANMYEYGLWWFEQGFTEDQWNSCDNDGWSFSQYVTSNPHIF